MKTSTIMALTALLGGVPLVVPASAAPPEGAIPDTTPPAPFKLLVPANKAVAYASTYGDKPRLAWQESSDKMSGLDHYEVWMDGAKVDTIPARTFGHLPGEKIRDYEPFRPYGFLAKERVCYYTPRFSDLTPGPHRWHVIAVDAGGNQRKCDRSFSFTVEDPGAAKDPLKIFVTPTGYLPGSTPRVVVDRSVAATSFEVVDMDGDVVFSGKLKDGGGAFGDYLVGNIAGFEDSGTYRIKAGSHFSMWFPIGLEAKLNYEAYLRKYRNAFRRKRCGDTTVNWGGKPCHLEDARMHGGKRHEITGGWHASGDVRKIIRCLQPGVLGFLEMKRLLDPAWDHGEDSILDEIKWGNSYIHKMQLENGAIGHHYYLWCDLDGWGEHANVYTDNIVGNADDRVLPESTVKIDMIDQSAFIESETGIYRMFKDVDPAYARKSLEAATRCYDYFEKTWPEVTDYETGYCARPYMEPVTDLMPIAYGVRANLSMHLATGEKRYKDKAVALADRFMALQETEYIEGQKEVRGFFYRDAKRESIFSSLMGQGYIDGAPGGVIVLADLCEALPTHPAAPRWKESLRCYLEDYLLPLSKKNAFGIVPGFISRSEIAFGQKTKMVRKVGGLHYQYLCQNRGSNKFLSRKAILLAKGHKILGNPELRDAAWRQLGWTLGNNPLSVSTVYGMGHNQPRIYKEELAPYHDGVLVMGIGGTKKDTPYIRGGHWRWAEMDIAQTVWFGRALFELLHAAEEPE